MSGELGGAHLFRRRIGGETTSIVAGTPDAPTNSAIEKHIFVGDKSDYYTLTGESPKLHDWSSR